MSQARPNVTYLVNRGKEVLIAHWEGLLLLEVKVLRVVVHKLRLGGTSSLSARFSDAIKRHEPAQI